MNLKLIGTIKKLKSKRQARIGESSIGQHHSSAGIALETNLLAQVLLMGSDQVNPLYLINSGMIQECLEQLLLQSHSKVVWMNYDIPDSSSINTVWSSASQANHLLSIPDTNHGLAVGERQRQILKSSLFCPKSC